MNSSIVPRLCRRWGSVLHPVRRMSDRRLIPWFRRPWPGHRSPWDDFRGPRSLFKDFDSHFQEMNKMRDSMFGSPQFRYDYFTRPKEAGEGFGTEVVEINTEGGKMEIKLDVQQYKPEELVVKVIGDRLVISGKHEQREDAHGYITRQFTREFTIPENIESESISMVMSDEGMLTIKGKPKDSPKAEERIINIEKPENSKKD